MPLPQLFSRSSPAGCFKGSPLKQGSLFLTGLSPLDRILLSENSKAPAHLLVVKAEKKPVKNSVSDSKSAKGGGKVLQSAKSSSWDGTNALAATEGLCIVVAAASYTASLWRNKQPSLVATESVGESKVLVKLGDLSTWYVPALVAALVINALTRAFQRNASKSTQKVWEERSIKDFTLDQRVGKLEEDLHGVVAIAQMLSRHLEKLGVRFRVTRRTLQDPIQESALLSQKTAEAVKALNLREQALEKELQETQQVLLAMQAQQAKQLDLLVSGISKSLKSQKALEQRISKELSLRLRQAPHISEDGSRASTLKEKGGPPPNGRKQGVIKEIGTWKEKGRTSPNGRKQGVIKEIGTLWKGLVQNPKTLNNGPVVSQMKGSVKEGGKVEVKQEESSVDKANGHAVPISDIKEQSSKKYQPDTSFKQEDFWASATAAPCEPFDYSVSAQILRETDPQGEEVSDSQSGSASSRGLDSFFSNKKRIDISQGETVPRDFSSEPDTLLRERDFSDPDFDQAYSQSGEHSSNNNAFS